MTRGRKTLTDVFTVARDPNLSEGEKVLWTIYRSYDSGRGAWPSDEKLAEHMDKGVRSVQAYRAKLLRLGYLQQTLRGPRSAVYRAVVPEQPQAPTPTADKPLPAYMERWDYFEAGIVEMEKLLRLAARSSEEAYRDREVWLEYPDLMETVHADLYDQCPDLYDRAGDIFEGLPDRMALIRLLDHPKKLRAELQAQLKTALDRQAATNGAHA